MLALDGKVGKVYVELQHLQAWFLFQSHAQRLSLAVGVGGEPPYLSAFCALCHVVFLVARDAYHCETLHVDHATLAVLVDKIVDCALVVALEYVDIQYVLADVKFVCHFSHFVFTILVEDNHIVDVGAVAHKLVFLQSGANESVFAVDIQFLIGFGNARRLDIVETAYHGASWIMGTVFIFQMLVPVDGHFDHPCQLVVDNVDMVFQRLDVGVGAVGVEFKDALHLDFKKFQDVVACHVAHKRWLERLQTLVDVCHSLVDAFALLILLVLIDALLDEYFLERGVEQAFTQLSALNLELALQQVLGGVHTVAQHVAHRQEMRLAVGNHAAVWRNAHLAVGKGVERVDSPVARRARQQVHDDVGVFRRVVVHPFYFDFSLFLSFDDSLDDASRSASERHVGDFQCLVVDFFDFCAHAY